MRVRGLIGFVFLSSIFSLGIVTCQKNLPTRIQSYPSHYSKLVPLKGTLFQTLINENLEAKTIQEIVEEARKNIDLRSLRPDTLITLVFQQGPLEEFQKFEISKSRLSTVHIERDSEKQSWVSHVSEKTVTTQSKQFQGQVLTTLWESAETAHMDPVLISKLSEVFAWQVDFSREIQSGDRWRITVDEQFVDGEHFDWGDIQVAELEQSTAKYQAVLYDFPKGDKNYFDFEGQSLRRMFLKSPIKFARISSRFTRKRFHPVLKRNRPHRGVDYAAAKGTPIRSVGDGVITRFGRAGGAGNMIQIRHNSIYSTAYMHMNGFARGLRKGSRVKQGQTIGYVGSTGLATGPHLHFEFHKNGVHINPLGNSFPAADPLPKNEIAKFQEFASVALKTLPNWKFSKEKVAANP